MLRRRRADMICDVDDANPVPTDHQSAGRALQRDVKLGVEEGLAFGRLAGGIYVEETDAPEVVDEVDIEEAPRCVRIANLRKLPLYAVSTRAALPRAFRVQLPR